MLALFLTLNNVTIFFFFIFFLVRNLSHFGSNILTAHFHLFLLKSFTTEVPVTKKPIHWFAEQINWLGSTEIRYERVNITFHMQTFSTVFSSSIYLFKVNQGNTRTMCEICSKLTVKAPGRRHLQISHNILKIPLLTLNK